MWKGENHVSVLFLRRTTVGKTYGKFLRIDGRGLVCVCSIEGEGVRTEKEKHKVPQMVFYLGSRYLRGH